MECLVRRPGSLAAVWVLVSLLVTSPGPPSKSLGYVQHEARLGTCSYSFRSTSRLSVELQILTKNFDYL